MLMSKELLPLWHQSTAEWHFTDIVKQGLDIWILFWEMEIMDFIRETWKASKRI